MASQRLKRTLRGALAATAIIAAIGTVPVTANADPSTTTPPPPTNAADATAQFTQLSQQADALNEQLHNAQFDLTNKQNQLNQANAALNTAKQQQTAALTQESQFRGTVDAVTEASFEGARVDQLSALLTGSSAEDYLNRATDLQNLAADNAQILAQYQTAVNAAAAAADKAATAQTTAQDATNAAQTLVNQIAQQQTNLNNQKQQVQAALNRLTSTQRASLSGTGIQGTFIAPAGVAGEAMTSALGKRGSEYVWGGSGPSTFDCSGLVMWAYEQHGVDLPHSSEAQSTMGVAVSRANLQPGDLVFFGSPVHHVGIYVGNGDMVDAPNSGAVVRVEALFSDYSGGRRLGG
ncbi:MAG TPA: NlpC/P60 family protein [Pseudonocardiaceae bacterium]|nr:NlpC/P60 family protein [Pseudonocardiaceae bacterium]